MSTAARRIITSTFLSSVLALFSCGTSEEASRGRGDPDIGVAVQAISLSSALGSPVYTGTTTTTCGLNNGVSPNCAVSSASDISFGWTAPSSDTFTFSTIGSNFDSILVISPYNNPTQQLACRNAISDTGGESVSLPLAAGEQIIITIDGYAALCGNFKLNITNCSASCTTACQTGSCSVDGQCMPSPRPAGTSCNDGDSCTSGDTCDGAGTCVGGSYTCCLPYDPSYCDPRVYCEVSSPYLTCQSGMQMYAWQTPDCRYCINRDACPGESGCPI